MSKQIDTTNEGSKCLNDSFRASTLIKGDIKNKLKSKKEKDLKNLANKLKVLYQASHIHFLEHLQRHVVKPDLTDE